VRRVQLLNPVPADARESPGDLSRAALEAAGALRPGAGDRDFAPLVGRLHGTDPTALAGDAARTAFWVNLYNALLLHATSLRPLRLHLALQPGLFRTVAYRVGSHDYTLDVIEHGLLRRNRRPPHRRAPVLDAGDERLRAAPAGLDPRVHFALNCGARSCPPIRSYEAGQVDDQLRIATTSYLTSEVSVDRGRGRVRLPGLMRLYREDFGSRADAVAFVARHLPGADGAWLSANGTRAGVRYGRFDARVAR
jgi:hypothetical protein